MEIVAHKRFSQHHRAVVGCKCRTHCPSDLDEASCEVCLEMGPGHHSWRQQCPGLRDAQSLLQAQVSQCVSIPNNWCVIDPTDFYLFDDNLFPYWKFKWYIKIEMDTKNVITKEFLKRKVSGIVILLLTKISNINFLN